MTDRKEIKKQLRELIQYKKNLPRLIDCSKVYGDNCFTNQDLINVDIKIKEIKKTLSTLRGVK